MNNITYSVSEELKEFDVDCISDSDSMPDLITGDDEVEMDICNEGEYSDEKTKIYSLLMNYNSIKMLKIFVDSDDKELHALYEKSIETNNKKLFENEYVDAGFDLFCPQSIDYSQLNFLKLDTKVKCSAITFSDSWKSYNSGYYLYPRSSIVKTNLRLANSVGVIDSSYRGSLIACFDISRNNILEDSKNNNNENCISQYTRLIQICDPALNPLYVVKVDNINELGETERGSNGFGSTGL